MQQWLTLDGAKHLALQSGTKAGEKIRDYFIDTEARWREEGQASSQEALQEERERRTRLEAHVEQRQMPQESRAMSASVRSQREVLEAARQAGALTGAEYAQALRLLVGSMMPSLELDLALPVGLRPCPDLAQDTALQEAQRQEAWASFVRRWWAQRKDITGTRTHKTSTEALRGLCAHEGLLAFVLGQGSRRSQNTRLGIALSRLDGHSFLLEDEDEAAVALRCDRAGPSKLYWLERTTLA